MIHCAVSLLWFFFISCVFQLNIQLWVLSFKLCLFFLLFGFILRLFSLYQFIQFRFIVLKPWRFSCVCIYFTYKLHITTKRSQIDCECLSFARYSFISGILCICAAIFCESIRLSRCSFTTEYQHNYLE